MSFGFGVGDCIAVAKLAWSLYHDCYLVAKGAPQEFRLVVEQIKDMHMTMKMLEEELSDPNTILVRAGEDRQHMVQNMLKQTHGVLVDLQRIFTKHRKLGNTSRTGARRLWDKISWAKVGKEVDELRNKVNIDPISADLLQNLT